MNSESVSEYVVVGIDPSSQRIAAVTTYLTQRKVVVETCKLPEGKTNRHEACSAAHTFVWNLVVSLLHRGYRRDHILVVQEAPVMGRGGPGATIPQAQTGGAMMAPCGFHNVPHTLIEVQVWKRLVVGNGAAKKEDVSGWLFHHHPDLYKLCLATNAKGEQYEDFDVCDAMCINLFGQGVLRRRERMGQLNAKGGKLVRLKKEENVARKSDKPVAERVSARKTSKVRSKVRIGNTGATEQGDASHTRKSVVRKSSKDSVQPEISADTSKRSHIRHRR